MLYEVNFSLARDFSVSQYLLFPKAVAHWLPGERLLTAKNRHSACRCSD
jgi:hypothetical protein